MLQEMFDRNAINYLEDEGLVMRIKTGQKEEKKQPPKLRRTLRNIDYLAESGLNFLTNENPHISNSLYNESSNWSYLEQCFNILDRIGIGSFGHVLKVFSRQDSKFYALKLAKQPFRGERDRTLKLTEVENHSLLSGHPNIVTLHSAWEEDRLLYMLMELCRNSLAHHNIMTEQQCWEVLADMTSALDLMHTNGLGHFDVKLENILQGYDGFYKLADFGLTFKIRNPTSKHPLEGDAKYLAPELLSNVSEFSEKADIFSLGISILELAGNLSLPSHGEIWSALRQNKFPRTQTSQISDELLHVLTKMMAKDPEERPTTTDLLTFPRLRTLVEQRHGLLPQPLAFPTDSLQLFMLVSTLLYAILCEALKQLLKQDFTDEFSSDDLSTTESGGRIYTSTPTVTANSVQKQQSDDSRMIITCDMVRPSTSQDYFSDNNRYYISPAVMSCNISPIKMSREIKMAIKERLSKTRKCGFVSRRLFFENMEETGKGNLLQQNVCPLQEDIANAPQDNNENAPSTSRSKKRKRDFDARLHAAKETRSETEESRGNSPNHKRREMIFSLPMGLGEWQSDDSDIDH